jgi:hypothetical protein
VTRSRAGFLLPLVVLAALVNLPLVHSTATDARSDDSALVVITAVADVMLLLGALLVWRFGARPRPRLRAIALEDVERCAPEIVLERLHGEDYLVRGKVLEAAADRVVLDLGNRAIEVLLDGHRNPVGHQQAAQVRARMIG